MRAQGAHLLSSIVVRVIQPPAMPYSVITL
jgi:hypothetical protein